MEPYRAGEQLVSVVIDEDIVRARLETVVSCTRLEPDVFSVVTDKSIERVDRHGEGGGLTPMTNEWRQEFAKHPDGFEIASESIDIMAELDKVQALPEQTLDQEGLGYDR